MENEKMILNLTKAGDNLSKPRQVDYWLYFKTAADREKFNLESKEYSKNSELHYQLKISRVDKVDIDSITKITTTLKKKAAGLNGDYDGWETVVIKGE